MCNLQISWLASFELTNKNTNHTRITFGMWHSPVYSDWWIQILRANDFEPWAKVAQSLGALECAGARRVGWRRLQLRMHLVILDVARRKHDVQDKTAVIAKGKSRVQSRGRFDRVRAGRVEHHVLFKHLFRLRFNLLHGSKSMARIV